ncbi:MAG: hypothetical protein ABR602_10630 [Gemmatimonadales bacterium]
MSDDRIVVGQGSERAPSRLIVESPAVWKMIAPVGVAFLLVGLTDIALSWYPMRFGTPEWEFGTIGTTLNNLPLPTLGLLILAGWAAVTERRTPVKVFGVLMMVVGVVLAGLVVIYLLTVPPAWNAANSLDNASAMMVAKKGIAKSLVQAVVYPAVYLWAGYRAMRLTT